MIEVGYMLKCTNAGRMLSYFRENIFKNILLDLKNISYDQITDFTEKNVNNKVHEDNSGTAQE